MPTPTVDLWRVSGLSEIVAQGNNMAHPAARSGLNVRRSERMRRSELQTTRYAMLHGK